MNVTTWTDEIIMKPAEIAKCHRQYVSEPMVPGWELSQLTLKHLN